MHADTILVSLTASSNNVPPEHNYYNVNTLMGSVHTIHVLWFTDYK